MSPAATSYLFHEQLESPLAFFKREWRAILLFGGGFTAVMVSIVLLIDPSFFYPRLETDALLYYLKAKSFADSGTTAARLAVNLTPFPYASMPGVLRAPFVAAFSEFDIQLRAIQLANIVIVDAFALMAAYILSWVVPLRRHWMAIAFAFGFVMCAPWWQGNIFMPMVDAPYAVFSLLSMIIAIRVIASPLTLMRAGPIALLVAVFVLAFSLRYTEPVVLVLIAVLVRGKFHDRSIYWRRTVSAVGVALIAIGILFFLNREAIFGRYLREPWAFVHHSEKTSLIVNIFALSIPEQIIPGFALGFSHPPIIDLYHASFAATTRDALWSVFGAMITVIVVLGAWRGRGKLLPELLTFLAVMPVLASMMPSTPRYFMTYQPFFWIAFFEGARWVMQLIPGAERWLPVSRPRLIATASCIALLIVTVGARRTETMLSSQPSRLMELVRLPHHVRGVSETYRPLRRFIESLPKDRTLLTSSKLGMGRWKVIADIDAYSPDSSIFAMASQKDLYMVVECGTASLCELQDARDMIMKENLCKFGEFSYELVFSAKSDRAAARVYRVRPAT